MERKNLRKFALLLALIEILSIHSAKADEHLYYILDKEKKLRVVDDKEIVIKNGKTIVEDEKNISIYNRENTISRQFGGDQGAFNRDFSSLVGDPYIWEEMQRYAPVSRFPSFERAMLFYMFYFRDFCEQGCGYFSNANRVIQEYEGNPEAFEERFGFPMYTIAEDGSIDFNYELLALKMFNFQAFYPGNNEERTNYIIHLYDKTIAAIILANFKATLKYDYSTQKWFEFEGEEQMDFIAQKQKLDELEEEVENARDKKADFVMSTDNKLGHIREFLGSFGIEPSIDPGASSYGPGDIVVLDHCVVYKVDPTGGTYSKLEVKQPHSFNIVSMSNGQTIVSTWGQRYTLDDSMSSWKLVISIDIPDRYKTTKQKNK